MVCGYFRKEIPCEILGIYKLVMAIRISQMKDHSIYVDQVICATSVVVKYLYTVTVKASTKFYKTTLPSDMIFTKDDTFNSDEQV